ncbi:outer membrane beta-barrel protein [Nitrospira sp. MA-1]|nr:outer membrane beta-barrel protein [Nitrospira sp. MA-1]
MISMAWWIARITLVICSITTTSAFAGESERLTQNEERSQALSDQAQKFQSPQWHYGGFVDLGYSQDFNYPDNHLFRNRGTTPRVNELELNMGGAYIMKSATEQSRWGAELLGQGGQDSKDFGFGTNLPHVPGSDVWRHFGRANLSYLAPVGNGLTIQAGLFNSFIGYESLYAKDNFNYTRSWVADYSPYLMFGANAVYPVNDRWTGAVFIINEYFHLQDANNLPSYGAQTIYKPGEPWTIKETVYYGPDQSNTSLEFWRFFSDTIVEWKSKKVTIAGQYQIGTQKNATVAGNPRLMYMGAALHMRWHLKKSWFLALRPELYSDPNGLITGSEQFVWAVTATAEYRLPYEWTNSIFRLEYRHDNSTGPGGGFFKGAENRLTPSQNLLIFSVIWTFDSQCSNTPC